MIEDVGETTGTTEPGCSGRKPPERPESFVESARAQHLEDRPDERINLPRIAIAGSTCLQHHLAQLSGKAEFDVCRDAVGCSGPGRS